MRAPLTEPQVRDLLLARAKELGSQTALARAAGVAGSYCSEVLNGRRPPNEQLLELIGFERHVVYSPKEVTP